tara:strand:- start:10884 stop:11105 length:222 start_codon:yes stop_codon:yes gene_type:complete
LRFTINIIAKIESNIPPYWSRYSFLCVPANKKLTVSVAYDIVMMLIMAMAHRNAYYDHLEIAQKGSLDITPWL